ncbi:hypothetical protein SDC9_207935 [bioreactor metagenome]|uniref:Uncharacterized protein n=1 Tax=bioreactor metagenome TaxID=1076179 RepID=A0A645JAM0_9ZZZZ
MGDVDKGSAKTFVQLDDLGAHRGAQLGIEVRQGLIQQKNGRVAHHGAA